MYLEKLLRVEDFNMFPILYMLIIVERLLHFIKSLTTFVLSIYSKIGAFSEFMGVMDHPSESSMNQLTCLYVLILRYCENLLFHTNFKLTSLRFLIISCSSHQLLIFLKTFDLILCFVTKAHKKSYSESLLSTTLDHVDCQNSEEREDSTRLIFLASEEHIKLYPKFIEVLLHSSMYFSHTVHFSYVFLVLWGYRIKSIRRRNLKSVSLTSELQNGLLI